MRNQIMVAATVLTAVVITAVFSWWMGSKPAGPVPVTFTEVSVKRAHETMRARDERAASAHHPKAETSPRSGVHPVVVVVFDELSTSALLSPSGKIRESRFPNFHALAKTADFYPNNVSAADMTFRAVPAILTGKLPTAGQVPDYVDHPDNMFTALHENGFRVKSREILTELCKPGICLNDRQGNVDRNETQDPFEFSKKKMAAYSKEVERETRPLFVWEIADFIKEGATDDVTPSFTFMHVLTPHEPYMYLPTGQIYEGGYVPEIRTPGDGVMRHDQNVIDAFLQRYVVQVGYADQLAGQIMEQLKTAGVWDQSMVVFSGDHGVAIETGVSRRIASDVSAETIASTPLFVKFPYQKKGRRSQALVSTVDVAPTVYRQLKMNPYRTDGKPTRKVRRESFTLTSNKDDFTVTRDSVERTRVAVSSNYERALGGAGIWKLGPRPDLVGRELSGVSSRKLTVHLDNPAQFEDVDPRAEIVPAFINGSLTRVGEGEVLAIAVNGKVAGTTRAFQVNGEIMFSCVINPSYLLSGRNRVEVRAVR